MDSEKLYEALYMQVYSYVMTLCRNSEMAEEITQETFFKAMNASRNADFKGRSNELTWLCAIAKNLFADEMRKHARVAELPEDMASEENFVEKSEDKDISFRIHIILHSLEEPYKEVFQLRVFGELPFAKIGELFGKTENWARVTYHRAKLKVQERMDCGE